MLKTTWTPGVQVVYLHPQRFGPDHPQEYKFIGPVLPARAHICGICTTVDLHHFYICKDTSKDGVTTDTHRPYSLLSLLVCWAFLGICGNCLFLGDGELIGVTSAGCAEEKLLPCSPAALSLKDIYTGQVPVYKYSLTVIYISHRQYLSSHSWHDQRMTLISLVWDDN